MSLDLYRSESYSTPRASEWPSVSAPSRPTEEEYEEDEEGEYNEEVIVEYDRLGRVARDARGQIVTKHNADVCGARNRDRVDLFPDSFQSGDMARQQARDDFKLSNRVFNSLKQYADRRERGRARVQDKRDRATAEMSLDKNTRLVIFNLVNAGALEAMHGAISSGKEAVVFHGTRLADPENPESQPLECAIKVFKTTLTEFKERQQFLHGDRRYDVIKKKRERERKERESESESRKRKKRRKGKKNRKRAGKE